MFSSWATFPSFLSAMASVMAASFAMMSTLRALWLGPSAAAAAWLALTYASAGLVSKISGDKLAKTGARLAATGVASPSEGKGGAGHEAGNAVALTTRKSGSPPQWRHPRSSRRRGPKPHKPPTFLFVPFISFLFLHLFFRIPSLPDASTDWNSFGVCVGHGRHMSKSHLPRQVSSPAASCVLAMASHVASDLPLSFRIVWPLLRPWAMAIGKSNNTGAGAGPRPRTSRQNAGIRSVVHINLHAVAGRADK